MRKLRLKKNSSNLPVAIRQLVHARDQYLDFLFSEVPEMQRFWGMHKGHSKDKNPIYFLSPNPVSYNQICKPEMLFKNTNSWTP